MALVREMNAPRFLTLTLKSTGLPLQWELARMREAFKKLRRTSVWRECVDGGVYGVEVTRNSQTGAWHPHIHIIFDGRFCPQPMLKAAWLKATGDSDIVDIRKVPDRRNAACYIAKYVLKGNTRGDSDGRGSSPIERWPYRAIVEFFKALHGIRLLQTFGSMHGRKFDSDDEEPVPNQTRELCPSLLLVRAADAGDRVATALVDDIVAAEPGLSDALDRPPPSRVRVADGADDDLEPIDEIGLADRVSLWWRENAAGFGLREAVLASKAKRTTETSPQLKLWERQPPVLTV